MKKLTVVLLLFTLSSCLTDSKLKKHADMYYAAHPDAFAHRCADLFPVSFLPGVPVTKSDTSTIPGIIVPCPDQITINPVTGDTSRTPGKKIECPPSLIIHDTTRIHDTIENTARIKALGYDTARLNNQVVLTTAKADKAEKRGNIWRFVAVIAIAALIGVFYSLIRRLMK